MTFSIAAYCRKTGAFGISVSSSSPAVAARCAFARAGVGAVATQNITDPTLGPRGLELLEAGASARAALESLKSESRHVEYRQVTLIDGKGETAVFSGAKTLGVHATDEGLDCVAAGNLLKDTAVPALMTKAFERSSGHLGDRLLTAMKAAREAGGEVGPVHSAGLLVVEKVAWPTTDLRVDWCDGDPIAALFDLWTLWKPQAADYVTRALDPSKAPSYGVLGDE